MPLILRHIDNDHTHALTDRFREFFIVQIPPVQALFIDVNLFVKIGLEVTLESLLKLFNKSSDEIFLPVAIANEAGILIWHTVLAPNYYKQSASPTTAADYPPHGKRMSIRAHNLLRRKPRHNIVYSGAELSRLAGAV
jgi:hypothetical protein